MCLAVTSWAHNSLNPNILLFSYENNHTTRNPTGVLPKAASQAPYRPISYFTKLALFTWDISQVKANYLGISTNMNMGYFPCSKRAEK